LAVQLSGVAWAAPEGDAQTYFSDSPKAVTLFYPNLGEVSEEFILAGEFGQAQGQEAGLIIYLPGSARPETLTMNFTGGRVLSMHSEALKPMEADPVLDPLRTKVDEARSQEQVLAAQLAAVQARLEGLNSGFLPESNIAKELEQLNLARQKAVPDLAAEAADLERELEKASAKRGWLESELSSQAPSWRIKAVLLREEASGDTVSYSYIMNNCGWSPIYRLEALPDQKIVQFAMSAEVWQRSGLNWKDTALKLATVQPGRSLHPGRLWPWRIDLKQPQEPVYEEDTVMLTMDAEIPATASVGGSARVRQAYAPPQEIQRTSFALWELGAKSMIHGETTSFAILEEKWTAKFSVTLRPLTGPQGFLTAEVDKDKAARNLPDGQGLFLVDNTSVGQGAFSPLSEDPIFFGPDPMLFADMVLLDSKSNETGIISKDRTMAWDWRITVHNKRKVEIPVRVEDAKPIVGDERIKLSLSSQPVPQTDEEKQIYFWEQTMPPESEWVIEHKLRMTAPADLPVSSTR
jgi:uncharacterized protein (TIGR02231 family)